MKKSKCCEKCKAKSVKEGVIGTPWCGKLGNCECHKPSVEVSKCCGAEALIQVGGRYGCKKCENYCDIESSITESKEQLKEEWQEFSKLEYPSDIIYLEWWLIKLDLLLKQQKDGIVKEIEKLRKEDMIIEKLEDVINIINNNHLSL